jgi:hypothetical protein
LVQFASYYDIRCWALPLRNVVTGIHGVTGIMDTINGIGITRIGGLGITGGLSAVG